MTDAPQTTVSTTPLIITGLNQVLIFDFDQVTAFGLEMHVYGGPREGIINLTPMLLRGLAEMASSCADKLEAEYGFRPSDDRETVGASPRSRHRDDIICDAEHDR